MSTTNRANKNKLEHVGRANLNSSNMSSLSSSSLPASESIPRSGGGNTRRHHSSVNASTSHGAALGGRMGAVSSTSLLSTDNVACLSNNNNNNIEINDFNRTGVPGSTLNKQVCTTSDQQSSQLSNRLVEGGKCMDVSNGMEEGGGSMPGSSTINLKHGVSNSSSSQDIRFVHHPNLDIPTSSHCSY